MKKCNRQQIRFFSTNTYPVSGFRTFKKLDISRHRDQLIGPAGPSWGPECTLESTLGKLLIIDFPSRF